MGRGNRAAAVQALLMVGVPALLLCAKAWIPDGVRLRRDGPPTTAPEPVRASVYRGPAPCELRAALPRAHGPYSAGVLFLEGRVAACNHQERVCIGGASSFGETMPAGHFREAVRLTSAQLEAIAEAVEILDVCVDAPGLEGTEFAIERATLRLVSAKSRAAVELALRAAPQLAERQ